jgi:uncharacterized protein with PIN domain
MVLDASAVIAVIFDEDEREIFGDIIAASGPLLISAASVFESSLIAAVRKSNPNAAALVDHMLHDLRIEIVPSRRNLSQTRDRPISASAKAITPRG